MVLAYYCISVGNQVPTPKKGSLVQAPAGLGKWVGIIRVDNEILIIYFGIYLGW